MKKTLSEYLKIGSEAEIPTFPITNHELRSLLDNLETVSKPTFKHKLITHKGKIIMGIIGLSFIATLISLSISYFSPSPENKIISSIQADNNSISSNFDENINKNKVSTAERNLSSKNMSNIKENSKISLMAENKISESKTSGKERDNKISNTPKPRIAGIEKLILTQDEMEKIGINYNNGKYFTGTESLFDMEKNVPPDMKQAFIMILKGLDYNTDPVKILAKGINIIGDTTINELSFASASTTGFSLHSIMNKYTGWDYASFSQTLPVAITSIVQIYNSEKKIYETSASLAVINDFSPLLDSIIPIQDMENYLKSHNFENYLNSKSKSFLPVHLTILNDNLNLKTEVDIWYYVNKEFANLLPEKYKTPILEELELMTGIEDGKITPEDACNTLNGKKSYLDLCHQSGSIILDAGIFPNPATEGQFEIKFSLKEHSKIRIDIYGVSGEYIKSLKDYSEYSSGINSEKFSTQGLNQGVFLVAITNDKGEQIIRKLLIK